MTFRVNQKVVCVDDSAGRWCGRKLLKKGSIYTIEGFDPETTGYPIECWGFYLVGILNLPHPGYQFPIGWNSKRFRPAVDRKTSIEIFHRMLNPSPDTVKIQIIADKLAEIYESVVP